MFPILLWPLGRPHDAHDADDAGSWGAPALKMRHKPQQNAHNTRCGLCLWFSAIFDAFSWAFDPSWCQSSQIGVPLVLMMLLYEARERARWGSAQEHHQHNWDPILGRFELN